ncbi:MAG: hypothetical protein F6K36_28520 [Symploca sp. SIO3C6]|nr:hypothetical protein [Symploca sp. SIO3C6]
MPKTDFSFEEINSAAENPIFTLSGTDIVLSLSALTGDTYSDLTSEGAVEALFKLRALYGSAQDLANATLEAAEQMTAFPAYTVGAPDDAGNINVTQLSVYDLAISFDKIIAG